MWHFHPRLSPIFFLSLFCLLKLATGDAAAQVQPKIATNPCQGFTHIKTAADLDQIRTGFGLNGKYCLDNDLDLSSIANFAPIGGKFSFSGQFNGQGFAIRNMTITSSAATVGLFGTITGSVFKLGVVNAKVIANGPGGEAGIIAGEVLGSISNSYATGSVKNSAGGYQVGGITGYLGTAGKIIHSWASASVKGLDSYEAGGVAGMALGQISGSFATGAVSCGTACRAGGLVGANNTDGDPAHGVLTQSFATGPVSCAGGCYGGGLAGASMGKIQQSYASGPVSGLTSTIGGLVGGNGGTISQSYSVGPIGPTTAGYFVGGFIGESFGGGSATNSYWDVDTSGKNTSAGGTSKLTQGMQTAVPVGFAVPPWAITQKYSYPYLNVGAIIYASALATTVVQSKVYVFLPVGQLEPSEYTNAPAHAEKAARAAVYTMLGRAIGITDNVAALKNEKIDKYYWDDATQTATWAGPVTSHATLGAVHSIPAATPIDNTNVIVQLRARKVVIVRGTYTKAGKIIAHDMLATLYTSDSNGNVTALVANDPWTGKQVKIDPGTKQVVWPSGFPLSGWTVKSYWPVTLN